MNAKVDNSGQRFDIVKWLIVIAIILGGAYANMMYANIGVFYRALAGVGLAAVAVLVALQTEQGRAVWNLAKEARVEVRKVVWPTRQETTQTTLIVVVVVFLVGLLLWGLDSGLSWGVAAVIG
ncbi:MAG: preprotein translocase subunit SecE [Pseudomonadales bacterium]